jgi:Photosynthetic reaction centre cytochrome C subunit
MRLVILMLLCLLPALSLPPQGGRRGAPKNLKILKPDEVMPAMAAFRTSLGVMCTHCHVQGDFASDDNPKKIVARNMIEMTHEINAKFPDGKEHVTCYTCHRGAVTPVTAPAPAQ